MNKKAAITVTAGALAVLAVAVFLNARPPVRAEQVAAVPPPAAASKATPEANMTPIPPQVIEITAKNGYSPMSSVAKANTPTTLRFTTSGTFDCSSSIVIPDLHYHTRLPMNGTTEVPVPPQAAGTELTGTCGMGMYSFTVKFAG